MNELKLYEISEDYISYINTAEKKIFSLKGNVHNHTRKYLGIVYSINNYNYYIPLSSPKNSDYCMENGIRKIRKSIIPIIRITAKSSLGELELKGTLKLSKKKRLVIYRQPLFIKLLIIQFFHYRVIQIKQAIFIIRKVSAIKTAFCSLRYIAEAVLSCLFIICRASFCNFFINLS